MGFYGFLLGTLAVWRVTHLLAAEDGPREVLARFRRALGGGLWGRLLDCFYCLSLWIALPFALVLAPGWEERGRTWRSGRLHPTRQARRRTMSCCGNHRGPVPPSPILAPRPERQRPPALSQGIRYEYVGASGMTVIGPLTGQPYRFAGHGSRVLIDPRDAASMATVPHVRRV